MKTIDENVKISNSFLENDGIDIIFLGNPGVGKSTLASSFSGGVFESGPSWGRGLTTETCFRKDGKGRNIRWLDTPGLNDPEIRSQAIVEIEKAIHMSIEKGRGVKVVFVCFLQAGRINPLDIITINDVMTSIKLCNGESPRPNSYTVLFNKMDTKMIKDPEFQTHGKYKIEGYFRSNENENPGKLIAEIPTTSIIYFPMDARKMSATNKRLFDETDDSIENKALVSLAEMQLVFQSQTLKIEEIERISSEFPDLPQVQKRFEQEKEPMNDWFDEKTHEWRQQDMTRTEELLRTILSITSVVAAMNLPPTWKKVAGAAYTIVGLFGYLLKRNESVKEYKED